MIQFWLKFCCAKKGLEKNWKGRSFWERKKLVVGHDYVHPNVENLSGPSTKEVV